MKNFKKWITSPIATVILFVAAAGLLLFSTIGGVRAAFIAYSDMYRGEVALLDIGVTLLEKSAGDDAKDNPRPVAYRNYVKYSQDEWDEYRGELLTKLLGNNEEFIPGKPYLEEISVANTGSINEWVRVTIYKYWTDPNGNKVFTDSNEIGESTPGLSPSLIKLEYANLDSGDGKGSWIPDEKATTEERQVFYYNKLLKVDSDTKDTPLTSTLTVDTSVAKKVTQTPSEDGKTIVTSYDYDGWKFCIEATVDAVQERNAVAAIKSAWGRDVSFREDGTMKLE